MSASENPALAGIQFFFHKIQPIFLLGYPVADCHPIDGDTMKDHLIIFDTTLRDGEQSPGASMTRDEKVRIAKALERLKVDVIEAGFPADRKSTRLNSSH